MAAGPLDLARSRGARVEHAGRAGAVGVAGAVAAEQTGDGGLHGGRAPAGRAAGADAVGDRVDRVRQLGPGVLDLTLDRVRVALLRIVLLRHVASMLAAARRAGRRRDPPIRWGPGHASCLPCSGAPYVG